MNSTETGNFQTKGKHPGQMSGMLSHKAMNCLLLHFFVHGNLLTITAQSLEPDSTVSQSEQSVIAASAHVGTGMNFSAALLDENVACQNELTVSTLHAKALGLGIAAVFSRADTFFMSHSCTSELDLSVNCAVD